MNEAQLPEFENFEFLQWNIPEDITDIKDDKHDTDEKDKKKSLLEQIFPPREWTNSTGDSSVSSEGPRTWRQTISKELPTRDGIIKMMKTFKNFEKFNKIQNHKLCRARSALYSLYFDEVLRQVTISDENRGEILYEIRNEFKNMYFIFKQLHEKGSIYADKYLNTEKPDKLTEEIKELTKVNNELKMKCSWASLEYSNSLRRKQYEEIKRRKRVQEYVKQKSYIIRSTKQLIEQLNIVSPPKMVNDDNPKDN